MYLDIKENTEERKFGVITMDENGFVNPIYYTRSEWEKIIKTIEKEIMDYDVSRMFQSNNSLANLTFIGLRKRMYSSKFEIIIKCNKCNKENKVYINGWARHTYDDCDPDIRLNIICNVCGNEDTITV